MIFPSPTDEFPAPRTARLLTAEAPPRRPSPGQHNCSERGRYFARGVLNGRIKNTVWLAKVPPCKNKVGGSTHPPQRDPELLPFNRAACRLESSCA